MTESDSSNDSNSLAVDLAGFIEDHSSLLVVMGVFAAVAVYISQSAPTIGTSTDAQLMYATGFVSALGMTLLFLVLVYKELATEIGSWQALHHAHYRLENLPLALFTLFNGMLVLSISYLIYQFEPVIFILLLVATVFIGSGIVLRLLYNLGGRLPDSTRVRIPLIFVVSVVTAFASDYIMKEYMSGFELSTIQEMSLMEPVPVAIAVAYLLVGSIRAAAALGVFASLAAIPIVAFDKIRGKGRYGNP